LVGIADYTDITQPNALRHQRDVERWEFAFVERTASYKVCRQIVGVDEAPVLAASVDESDAQLTELPAGATVKITVIATNAAGDAPMSEEIELLAA
jgi:hypothetical protein